MSFTAVILRAARATVALWLITAVILTLPLLGIAGLVAGDSANGSVVYRDGLAVGSRLIGQPFSSARYLQGRPWYSSSLAVADPQLQEHVAMATRTWQQRGVLKPASDLIFASASGVDPHLSLQGARQQLPLLAIERNVPMPTLEVLLQQNLEKPITLKAIEPVVNVLGFNLALDRLDGSSGQAGNQR